MHSPTEEMTELIETRPNEVPEFCIDPSGKDVQPETKPNEIPDFHFERTPRQAQKETHPSLPRLDRVRVNTLALDGELNLEAIADIDELLYSLSRAGAVQLVVDFSEVSHFDYRGVSCFIDRARFVRRAGGDIKLCGMSSYIYAIFRLGGANDVFDHFATAPEAMAAFHEVNRTR